MDMNTLTGLAMIFPAAIFLCLARHEWRFGTRFLAFAFAANAALYAWVDWKAGRIVTPILAAASVCGAFVAAMFLFG